jgi:hypothetical protein
MIRTSYFAGSGVTPLIEVKPDATNPRKKGTRKPGKYSRAAAIGLAAPTPRAFAPGCPQRGRFFAWGGPRTKKPATLRCAGFLRNAVPEHDAAWCFWWVLQGSNL